MLVRISALLIAGLAPVATVAGGDLPPQYREPFARSWPIREAQHLQMKAYLDSFPRRQSPPAETEFQLDFSSVASFQQSLEPIRARLKRDAGWPPPGAVADPAPRFERVGQDQVADIYRVWTEVFAGVEAYAIYMVPRGVPEPAPVIIAVHGGSGCPEAICDLDTRVNYRSFGHEAVKRGYVVYAPGILMAVSYADPPDPRIPGANYKALAEQAAGLGTSTSSLQVYQIMEGARAVIAAREEADGQRIGMTGLSMGGGYTLRTAPLWTKVKVAVCSGGLGPRRPHQTRQDETLDRFRVGKTLPRVDLATLICPRPLMIQSGEADTVVPLDGARQAVPQVRACYEKLGVADRFEFHVHAGGHVFENEAIFRFFDKHLKGAR